MSVAPLLCLSAPSGRVGLTYSRIHVGRSHLRRRRVNQHDRYQPGVVRESKATVEMQIGQGPSANSILKDPKVMDTLQAISFNCWSVNLAATFVAFCIAQQAGMSEWGLPNGLFMKLTPQEQAELLSVAFVEFVVDGVLQRLHVFTKIGHEDCAQEDLIDLLSLTKVAAALSQVSRNQHVDICCMAQRNWCAAIAKVVCKQLPPGTQSQVPRDLEATVRKSQKDMEQALALPAHLQAHEGALGGQTPSLHAGSVQALWAVLYVQSCFKLCEKLRLEGSQTSKALLYAERALAVARAAKLQGSDLYACLLENILNIQLACKPNFAFRRGEHAIPYEAFTAAVARVKQRTSTTSEMSARFDSFIQEHACWVKELQADLVRNKMLWLKARDEPTFKNKLADVLGLTMTFYWKALANKPNCLQLPLDFIEPIMSSQMHDWEYVEELEQDMRILETEGVFGEATPSAADSIFTEALWYTATAGRKFKQRLHQGLNGRLEFAGLYAGIAAKYAYFCTLGKREDVWHHFGTQSWDPVHTELLVLGQPHDEEDVAEGLAYADVAWEVMQEAPKLLTYGARGPEDIIVLLMAAFWRSDRLADSTVLLPYLRQIRDRKNLVQAASAFVCQLIAEACRHGRQPVISLHSLLSEGLVIGTTAQSTALAILDSSSGFDLAAVYAMAGLQTSPDPAFAEHLFALLCKRASAQDLIPATQHVYRDMAVPQHVLQRLAAVLASVTDPPSCLEGSTLQDSAGSCRSPAWPCASLWCGLTAAACVNAAQHLRDPSSCYERTAVSTSQGDVPADSGRQPEQDTIGSSTPGHGFEQHQAMLMLPVQLLRRMQTLQQSIDADTWRMVWGLYATEDVPPDSEDILNDLFQIWAEHTQAEQERQGQATYLPAFQQLTTVCRLLCKRAEYAQALELAQLRPNMPAQQAAEHASIVFEAARAAQCQLDPSALRIIMARCLLGGTSAFLDCCSQAFDQLHASGRVNAEDVVVMVECHLRASKHWSALQLLKHHNLLAAAALPPHKQRNFFDLVLESRTLQKCSPQLLLKLLAVGLQQGTPDAKRQVSELVTACLKDEDMQLVKQVLATCDEYNVRLTGHLYAQLLKTQLLLHHSNDSSKTGEPLDDVLHALTCLKEAAGDEWAVLLSPRDRLALCAVLNKHMQHALLLQKVWPWFSKGTTEEVWKEAVHAAAAIHDKGSLLALWQQPALNRHHWNAPSGAAQVMSAHVLATTTPKQGVQLLMRYQDQGYAEALTTDQCNTFLQLCVADMADNVIYPEAELANTMLLTHMVDTQQPAPDMTSFALVLNSMLLALSQQHEDVSEQANEVLLSLYSSFLPLLHSQFATSSDTCVVYTQAMAAFKRIHDTTAAFQVFLLLAQNKVDGLTPECCEEVLDVLWADSSNTLLDYVEQHCGESFLEMLLAEQTNKGAVIQLPSHRSLPTLTMWKSADGSVQRLSVKDGPTLAWMLPAWQRFLPDDAVAQVPGNSTDRSSVTHAAEASSVQGVDSAQQLQPDTATNGLEMLSADPSMALQELIAMPKSKVKQMAASLGLRVTGDKAALIEQIMKTQSKQHNQRLQ